MSEPRRAQVAHDEPSLPSERTTWRPSGLRRVAPRDVLMQLSSNELCDEVTLLAAVVVATREPRPASLDVRAAWLLPFVDGERTVEDLVAQSGLSHVDALLGIHELVARRLAELHLTAGTAL